MTQKKTTHKNNIHNDYFFACCMLCIIFYYQNTRTRSSTNSSFKKTAFNHPSYIIYIRDKHINHNNIITSFLLDVVSIVDLLTFDPCIYRYYESDNNTLFAINNPGEY